MLQTDADEAGLISIQRLSHSNTSAAASTSGLVGGFFRETEFREEFVSKDSLSIRFAMPDEGKELRLTLNGRLDVTDASR